MLWFVGCLIQKTGPINEEHWTSAYHGHHGSGRCYLLHEHQLSKVMSMYPTKYDNRQMRIYELRSDQRRQESKLVLSSDQHVRRIDRARAIKLEDLIWYEVCGRRLPAGVRPCCTYYYYWGPSNRADNVLRGCHFVHEKVSRGHINHRPQPFSSLLRTFLLRVLCVHTLYPHTVFAPPSHHPHTLCNGIGTLSRLNAGGSLLLFPAFLCSYPSFVICGEPPYLCVNTLVKGLVNTLCPQTLSAHAKQASALTYQGRGAPTVGVPSGNAQGGPRPPPGSQRCRAA